MPTRLAPRSIACLLATLCAGTAAAAPAEAPYLEALPAVLSATRLPQALPDVPGAVTVIDRELLLASGYRDLARIFRLVPGMQVGQERGHAQWVTYHGLSNDFPTEMQVMIDGRSVITPGAFGGVDWSALALTVDEIDRIEIVRGTNASGYGANALLGIINIITRHAADTPGTRAGVRAGSRDIHDAHARWSGQTGPLAIRVSAETRRDGGFEDLPDARRMNTVALRGDWQASALDSVMLRATSSEGWRGEGYAGSLFDNNAARESHTQAQALHVEWRHTPDPGEEWRFSYYRNHEKLRDAWTASAPAYPRVPLDRNRHSVRDDIEIHHRATPGDTLQTICGAELRRDAVDSPMLFFGGNPDPQYLARVFANLEWRARPDLSLNLGGVQEKYSGAPSRFSPRAFLNWQAAPGHTLRGGVARAWRQRNLFEVEGDFRAIDPSSGATLVRPYLPNPDLRQTRVDSVELGWYARFDTLRTTLDVRLFNERIHDFIVRAPQPDPAPPPALSPTARGGVPPFIGSTRYENLDHAITLRGFEYQFVTRPFAGTELRLAHGIVEVRNADPALADRSAPYTASLSWLQDYGRGWSSMVSVLRAGPLAGGDGYVPGFRYVAKPYTTLDATVRYTTHFGATRAHFALTALNLGPRHQEIADRSQQAVTGPRPVNRVGPSVYLSARFAFD